VQPGAPEVQRTVGRFCFFAAWPSGGEKIAQDRIVQIENASGARNTLKRDINAECIAFG
jgi:hypothetical protein